ncbi:MAG TPA: type II toxin-antitoxin system Phd/YefM family antitoxin [Syntrophales bacterium]|nr:type II toxin-antitoxin system Phd/YefM family antitoxin [Syntrophales bacterium]
MDTITALTLRNHLGKVLRDLSEKGEPILVSKGKKIRAVLITPELFERRFLDYQAEEKKKALLETVKSLRQRRGAERDSLAVLRETRGYES